MCLPSLLLPRLLRRLLRRLQLLPPLSGLGSRHSRLRSSRPRSTGLRSQRRSLPRQLSQPQPQPQPQPRPLPRSSRRLRPYSSNPRQWGAGRY